MNYNREYSRCSDDLLPPGTEKNKQKQTLFMIELVNI